MNPYQEQEQPPQPATSRPTQAEVEAAYEARREEVSQLPARQRFGKWAIARTTKWELK